MPNYLYLLTIYPIELFLEIVFSIINRFSSNPGLAILAVSIAVSFLLLPLDRRANAIQHAERDKQEAMKQWIEHIKKHFKGDEQLMMLSTYYRKQQYRPYYSLRSSISLFLQIPFFIAAYHFLSNLNLLNGVSFLFINDLGAPDALLNLNGVSINVLPVIMTMINCISAIIYTKSNEKLLVSIRNNAQIYILALLFLILLYPSPSGLVLYWTMNNIFSLIKNVITRLCGDRTKKKKADDEAPSVSSHHQSVAIHYTVTIALTILTGVLIPSAVIAASPTEFVEPTAYRTPLSFVLSTACISSGLFLIWLNLFYHLAAKTKRKIMDFSLWILCGISTIDYFIFGRNLGTISSELEYDEAPVLSIKKSVICLVILVAVVFIMYQIWKHKDAIIPYSCGTLAVSFAIMSIINIVGIASEVSKLDYSSNEVNSSVSFPISKEGKNVVVIMMDRAISGYVPYIMAEKPELKETFSGFVYYPNTVSYGNHTNLAAPALFGGYEYSPAAINARPEETLVQKHDEALRIMPVLFSEAGFDTTVFDPPYAGYNEWPDLSIYDPYPGIHASNTAYSFMNVEYYNMVESRRRRSFFMYSLFRISPVPIQPVLYDEAQYLSAERTTLLPYVFDRAYFVLSSLVDMTEISDSDKDTFMTIANNLTHDPTELQLPDYTVELAINNAGLEKGYRMDEKGNKITIDPEYHYHANMMTFILLGKWIDYLKANGVYDNTRIIIVSDHGRYLGDFPDLILDDGRDMEAANPLLLFKDFNATGFVTSDEFMTNADTPLLAMQGLLDDPVNPFTGVPLTDMEKTAHVQYITQSHNSTIEGTNDADATVFDTSDAPWYSVHDNIFNKNNWKVVSSNALSH